MKVSQLWHVPLGMEGQLQSSLVKLGVFGLVKLDVLLTVGYLDISLVQFHFTFYVFYKVFTSTCTILHRPGYEKNNSNMTGFLAV